MRGLPSARRGRPAALDRRSAGRRDPLDDRDEPRADRVGLLGRRRLDHHAHERLGAARADEHASAAGERGALLRARGGDLGAAIAASRSATRTLTSRWGSLCIALRRARSAPRERLEGQQRAGDAVARRGEAELDDVAGLLAAERPSRARAGPRARSGRRPACSRPRSRPPPSPRGSRSSSSPSRRRRRPPGGRRGAGAARRARRARRRRRRRRCGRRPARGRRRRRRRSRRRGRPSATVSASPSRWVEPQPALMLRPSGASPTTVTVAPRRRKISGATRCVAPLAQSSATSQAGEVEVGEALVQRAQVVLLRAVERADAADRGRRAPGRAEALLQAALDLELGRVGELEAVAAEELDAVVAVRVVRGAEHRGEVEARSGGPAAGRPASAGRRRAGPRRRRRRRPRPAPPRASRPTRACRG